MSSGIPTSSSTIQSIATGLDTINDYVGRSLSWLGAAMALLVFTIVVLRSFFNVGSIAAQEIVTYLHATIFMLCLAYTAKEGGHVRVDILYRRFKPLKKAWVNALGSIMLLIPYAIFLTWVSWDFAVEAWQIKEGSINPGGIPALFLLKSLIPLAGILLILHGIAELLKNLMAITFKLD